LTKLLMDGLGGDSVTLMLACVSPSHVYADVSAVQCLIFSACNRMFIIARRVGNVEYAIIRCQSEEN
jgi:hypothetical protein